MAWELLGIAYRAQNARDTWPENLQALSAGAEHSEDLVWTWGAQWITSNKEASLSERAT